MRLSNIALAVTALYGTGPFNPRSLFANGEQGWVYDPSNLSTLFQDSAGTTPVTAMEQPVGLQLDLSGRGNHRRQTTSANRPVVSARVNLLTKTEDFSDAVWSKRGTAAITPDAALAPNGTMTADLVSGLGTLGSNDMYYGGTIAGSPASTVALSPTFYIKKVTSTGTLRLQNAGGNTYGVWLINLSLLSSEWEQITATHPAVTVSTAYTGSDGSTAGPQFNSTAGTLSFYLWGADLRVANIGVGLPAYQRVNTSTDYDTAGFPVYIKPNGSNQFMVTNSINFSATDKMTVWQGVRKLSDAALSMAAELSLNSTFSAGTFLILAPGTVPDYYRFRSKGTTAVDVAATSAAFAAPSTSVLTGQGNISGDSAILQVNGTRVASSASDQGTGNCGNYPAYFYSRAGTSLFFSGHDYGSICRGAASTAGEITSAETWINQRTKAY